MRRGNRLGPRVQEHEASGAVACSWPRPAPDTPGRTVLPADRRRCPRWVRREEPAEVGRLSDNAGRRRDRQKHRARNAEDLQHLLAPVSGPEVEAQRPRGVRRVGRVDPGAGELPDEPRVDGAEGELTAFGATARVGDLVEQPANLRAREVGVEDEPRRPPYGALQPVGAEPVAERSGAAALPDDRAMDRGARRAVPTRSRSRAGS